MAVDIYFVFNGNSRDAVEFYSKTFGAEVEELMTFGESPQNPDFQLPEEAKDLIMHARLTINGSTVMFSDAFPGQPVTMGSNVTLVLNSDSTETLTNWYEKLKDGGNVEMELQETFWSKLYGIVEDKFGIHWQINYNGD